MKWIVVISASLLALALVVAGFVLVRGSSVEQPIDFDHRLHIEDIGFQCTDCHLYAETGIRATIPNVDICAYCHAAPMTDSTSEALVVEHIEKGEPIPWRKVTRVPAHVFFSHRRHTSVADIECVTCHGDVEQRTTAFDRPPIKLSMSQCMDCHQERDASNDCILCHR